MSLFLLWPSCNLQSIQRKVSFLFFSFFSLFSLSLSPFFFMRQLGCLQEVFTLTACPGHLQGEVFTQGSFILFFFVCFFFLGCGWSGGRDFLHYQHCFNQILNEFLLGEGLPVDFQPMPIDKHADGFFIDGLDQN